MTDAHGASVHRVCPHPVGTRWKYTAPGHPQRTSCELCGCEDVMACPTRELDKPTTTRGKRPATEGNR